MPSQNRRAVPPSIAKLLGSAVACGFDGDMDALADQSPTGGLITIVGPGITACRGVYNNVARNFGGLVAYAFGNPSPDLTGDMTQAIWIQKRSAGLRYCLQRVGAFVQTALYISGAGLYSYNGIGYNSAAVPDPVNDRAWHHCATTAKGLVQRLFYDGLQIGRGIYTPPASLVGAVYIGINAGGGNSFWDGGLDCPVLCTQALSPQQIYTIYMDASRRPTFVDDLKGYPVDFAARPVGSECGPWRVVSGTLQLVVDSAGKRWVQGGGGGVAQWPSDDSAYGTWEFEFRKVADVAADIYLFIGNTNGAWNSAAQNGYALRFTPVNHEIQCWRIVGGVLTAVPFSSNVGAVSLNTDYRVRIVRRIGGVSAIYIIGGAYPDWTLLSAAVGSNPFTDNTYTVGPYQAMAFDGTSKLGTITKLLPCVRPTSFPWEFGPGGTSEGIVSGGLVWCRQLTAGLLFLPSDMNYAFPEGRRGWRTVDEKVYKAAGTTHDTILGQEILGSATALQYGYTIRISATGRAQWLRTDNGVETLTVETAAGFIADATEYERRITRDDAGLMNVYYRGGAYTTWTLATSVVANIHPCSNYYVSDMDADDRRSAPQFSTELKGIA